MECGIQYFSIMIYYNIVVDIIGIRNPTYGVIYWKFDTDSIKDQPTNRFG